MESFVFPSEEALEIALRSGLVPSEAHRAPARFSRAVDGTVEVEPSAPLAPAVRRALLAAGVVTRAPGADLSEVTCWAEALPLKRSEPSAEVGRGTVLFTVREEKSLLALCGELLRLGCDRQELSLVTKHPSVKALVRVSDAPWFVVSRAIDHLEGLRVFAPVRPREDALWVELGYRHPLDMALAPPERGLVLLEGDGAWRRLPPPVWHDVDQLVVAADLPVAERLAPADELPRITVSLELKRATRSEAPSLFVVRAGRARVESLVRGLPEERLEDVLFAVSGSTVALRVRPGREAAAADLPGEAYARLFDLPNLFAPAGLTVEPPLRRDRLRAWLAPDAEVVTWLEPRGSTFARMSLPEAAFRPLSDWVEYVIDGAGETLEAWVRSARFDFDAIAAAEDSHVLREPRPGAPEGKGAAAPSPADGAARGGPAEGQPAAQARRSLPRRGISQEGLAAVVIQAPQEPRSPSELEAEVAREETAFIELDAPVDSEARREAWVGLAALYSRAARHRDAGMAWAQALWEVSGEPARLLARRWASSSGVRPEAALAAEAPDAEQTRGAVAHLLASALEDDRSLAARLPAWQSLLDRCGDDLDVRSHWLGRWALARVTGGDVLGLARARDRVLARLQRGLSLERDVPRLLRSATQANAGPAGTQRAQRVTAQLEAILRAFRETPRKRSLLDAPPQVTQAYVDLEFAWGFARLAQGDRARELREGAFAVLDRSVAVHQYLCRAYAARLEQALEGTPPSTPLPAEVSALLAPLEPSVRFEVDRIRQGSVVLEPQERLSPHSSLLRDRAGARSRDELGALAGLADTAELVRAIASRETAASDEKLSPEERGRLVASLINVLPQLSESQAMPLLQRLLNGAESLPAAHRAPVLEDALKVAGHYGKAPLVRQLVGTLSALIKELGTDAGAELGATLSAAVRSLRRVGLRAEATELLARASASLKGNDSRTQQARLAVAGGFMYLGDVGRAQPIIDEVLSLLLREAGPMPKDRRALNQALANALGHAPAEVALPGLLRLAQQLPFLGTSVNTHLTLTVLELADAVVVGHVGDDLTLNELTRRFLEEDEYVVRRRVHGDVGG